MIDKDVIREVALDVESFLEIELPNLEDKFLLENLVLTIVSLYLEKMSNTDGGSIEQ